MTNWPNNYFLAEGSKSKIRKIQSSENEVDKTQKVRRVCSVLKISYVSRNSMPSTRQVYPTSYPRFGCDSHEGNFGQTTWHLPRLVGVPRHDAGQGTIRRDSPSSWWLASPSSRKIDHSRTWVVTRWKVENDKSFEKPKCVDGCLSLGVGQK